MKYSLDADSACMSYSNKDSKYDNLDLDELELVACSDCGGNCSPLYDINGEILCKICIKERCEED